MNTEEQINILLNRLLSEPSESLESDVLEFKSFSSETALHNSKDLNDEISAFANLKGGIILVGVKDSKQVPFGSWTEQLVGFVPVDLHTTRERLRGKVKPSLDLDLEEVKFQGLNYLVIQVPRSRSSLVATSGGKVCTRDGKSSRPMTPDEITNAVKNLQDYDWSAESVAEDPDQVLNSSAVNESLLEFVKHRRIESLSRPEFLEAIGATQNGVLTKSGLLFLGKPDAIRKCLGSFEYRFSQKNKSGRLVINDVWSDCLWETIKRGKAHFDKCNVNIPIKFEGQEYWVPYLDGTAFHEAYLNALVHRDYAVDGMISVNFMGDRLVITSPGSFYGGVTPENIAKHEPRHRNKALAKMLMTYHFVDRAGVGVLRMNINSLRYGRTFPSFVDRDNTVEVTMQGEFIRPGIFVLTMRSGKDYGIPELLILNSVYETGSVSVQSLIKQLEKIEDNPWLSIETAANRLDVVELCGSKAGIFIRVKQDWMKFFEVTKIFRITASSKHHVKLYQYLMRHGTASNTDIKEHLGFKRTTQTSSFLRKSSYVKRSGPRGPGSVWSIRDR